MRSKINRSATSIYAQYHPLNCLVNSIITNIIQKWTTIGFVWKCRVPLHPLWFCWSLSLLFMAISLGVYPIIPDRKKPTKCGLLNETGDSTAHSAWTIQQSDGKFATKNWELTIKHSQFNRFFGWWLPSGYVKIVIENDHRNSGFSHWKWWFSIVMLVCQRV